MQPRSRLGKGNGHGAQPSRYRSISWDSTFSIELGSLYLWGSLDPGMEGSPALANRTHGGFHSLPSHGGRSAGNPSESNTKIQSTICIVLKNIHALTC